MAKALREVDGKRIIHDYLRQLIEKDGDTVKHSAVLPSLRSVGVGPKTDLTELTDKHGWLEKEVRTLLFFFIVSFYPYLVF